jgi:PPP family 3-phenylpropionic acid transporter
MTARRFGIKLSIVYAMLMIGSGVQLPFLPLWLSAKGLSVEAIAAVVAGGMATRILGAPLFAWIADHFGNRRLVIQLCGGLSLASYGLLAISNGFGPIMTMALIASFVFAPVFPLTEGFGVDGAVAHGLDYGRLRLWASLSFLVGSLGSGALLTVLDPLDTAWVLAAAQGLAFLATLQLPDEPEAHKFEAGNGAHMRARDLFFGSGIALLLVAAGLAQASHAMLYSFSSVHWQSLGISSFWIGVLWVAAVSVEVLLFSLSNSLVVALGPGGLMLVGIAGGILRWVMMAVFANYGLLIVAQMLHALSFAATHLGTMHFIRLLVPNAIRNRAQGFYSAMAGGVFMSVTAYASGHLYALYGAEAYYVMAVMSVIAFALVFYLVKVSPTVRAAAAA